MNHLNQLSFICTQSRFLMLSLLAMATLLGGCATPATHQGMIPTTMETVKQHSKSVRVMVTGGKETVPMETTQISDTEMAQALTSAITKSKTFSRVVQGRGEDYFLTVSIFNVEQPNLEQPAFMSSFTVKMEAGWTLKRADTGATVWEESIKSEYTATTNDSYLHTKRFALATEGAARNNIALGLAKIQKLDL